MSLSVFISRTLDMDFQNTPLILSTEEDRWILSLKFAPSLIDVYKDAPEEEKTYSIGENVLLRLHSKEQCEDFIGESCEYCGDEIKRVKEPLYTLHETFDTNIVLHPRCFQEFVEDVEELMDNNTHLYISNYI